jgi:hypothetical protein
LEQYGCVAPLSPPPGHSVSVPLSVEVQLTEQVPPLQRSPMHDLPHVPQLFGSLLVFTQLPSQATVPLVQPPSGMPPLLPSWPPPLLLPLDLPSFSALPSSPASSSGLL